ncbi:sugar phosphate isomerase/epimerase family protein [Longibacter salinarum]|nr:sugar phosphate isomerase/epimerase [Longibacter salinarum]
MIVLLPESIHHMLPVWLTDTVTNDLGRALHYTELWGLEGVELRTVGGAEDRVPRVNESKISNALESSGKFLSAIVPSMFEGPVSDTAAWMNDLVTFDETLNFCDRLRCPRVVIPPFAAEEDVSFDRMADALRRAGARAEAHDVLVCVHHGTETGCRTGVELASLLAMVDHPNVRATWDPVASLRAGERPAEGLEALGERIAHVRCADGRITDGYWEDTAFGEGDIDWFHQLRGLYSVGYVGSLSLEVYVEPRPKYGLRAATTLIHMIRDVQREAV